MKTRIYQAVIALLAIALLLNQCDKNSIKNSSIAKEDYDFEMKQYRNALNQEVSQKRSIEAENLSMLLTVKDQRETISRLQDLARANEDALALISQNVRTDVLVETDSVEVVAYRDTFPVYESTFSDQWRSGSVYMGHDTLSCKFKVFNKFDFVLNERKRLFKPNEIILDITNLNPYTTTEDVDSFVLDSQISPWSIGFSAGYGMTNQGLSPQVSISLNYRVLQL